MCKFTSAFVVGAILAFWWVPSNAWGVLPADQVSLNKCQLTVGKEGEKLIQRRIRAIDTCLRRISIVLIKRNLADTSGAAKTCVRQFRRLNDTRVTPKDLTTKFLARVDRKCDPGAVTTFHTLEDILGTGATVPESINAENIGNWCGGFGGGGSITTYAEWRDCVLDSHKLLADSAVSLQYPRMLEWLDAVRPFMAAVTPPVADPDKVTDALAGLDEVNDADLEGLADDDVPSGPVGTRFPASGQTTVYTADKNDGIVGAVAVPDDGTIQAGAPLRYADNGDGTITDLNTRLMWEKKGDNGTLHDQDNKYRWSGDGSQETIWDWLDDINTEGGTGFAGHSDWRIPNAKELQSIVDYERINPSVDPVFNTGCVLNCTVTTCSCTRAANSWSSTTRSPAQAWVVNFDSGNVSGNGKSGVDFVRAVRGG